MALFEGSKLVRARIVNSRTYPDKQSIRCHVEPDEYTIKGTLQHYITKAGFETGERVVIIPEDVLNRMIDELGQAKLVALWNL